MATAREAREWAQRALRGIGDSLYTPFCGPDGDDIDWAAYRALVRYCAGDLGHPLLWCTSGIGEFWSLTLDERKRLLEVAIEEARAANPDIVVQAWDLVLNDKLVEAMDYGRDSGLDQFDIDLGSWFTCYPERSDYFTHWGGAFKYAASVLGLPIGAYPHSRPPQAELPAAARAQIEDAYRRVGLIDH
jgi:dihydrodipicolinate synthase/N-acetylneuraminate lyase